VHGFVPLAAYDCGFESRSGHGYMTYSMDEVLEKLIVTLLVIESLVFMESEGSPPCLQEPVIGPYPESDESSPHPHSLCLQYTI
jgi:hypothetical protein